MARTTGRRARLDLAEEEAARQLQITSLLLEAADALSGWTDLDALMQGLADIVLKAIPHRRVIVALIAEDGASIRLTASAGEAWAPVGTVLAFDELSAELRHSYATGETVTIDYDAIAMDRRGLGGKFPLHFSLIVPLMSEDRALGHFSLDDLDERKEFTEHERRIASGIASQAAVAIVNARLLESARRAARFATTLAKASEALGTSLEPDEVLAEVARGAGVALGAKEVTITLRQEAGWVITHHWGSHGSLMGRLFTDGELPGHAGVVATGEPHIVCETASPLNTKLADELGYRAFVIQPLTFRGSVIGTIDFTFAEPRLSFSEDELDFMVRMAFVVSASIENARLTAERAQQIRLAEALNWINRQLHSSLELPQIMEHVVVETARALKVDAVAVQLKQSDHWEYTYSHGLPEALRSMRLADDQVRLSVLALESGKVVASSDPEHDPRTNPEFIEQIGVRSVMAVPLMMQREGFGVLVILCFDRARTFTDLEVDFASKVGATLSLSLENARIYETQYHIAQTLQQALLAMPGHVAGVEFAHYYHSATEAMLAGGDFFDIFELAEGRVAVLIGDVAGAGLDAAVLTSLVKNTIRAHAADREKSPEQVLTLTNEVVYRATPTESFATVFLGVFDLVKGTLTYSNAGHPTGALVREDGSTVRLPSTGPLLGALTDVEFGQEEVGGLDGEQLLFLYTDGVTEARRDVGLYGEARLFEVLSGLNSIDADEVAQAVVADVLADSNGRLRDDLAILAVRPRPEEGAADRASV